MASPIVDRALQPPRTRAEFERNLSILLEKMKRGQFHFGPAVDMTESLLAVRRLPNGRLDLLSIDERVRLLANMISDQNTFGPEAGEKDLGSEVHANGDAEG